ncbi:hypothetical protein AVEN_110945-1 [Araneus ventricosus]|uniref:Uncharacterized protein n=1 Tax=Araneus ventricosus TaxID=182803 RepID=A0A4Y2HDB1_ARAVE|nr:hypothetical protein AVEN_110945-1 [Araneus ventricosus]
MGFFIHSTNSLPPSSNTNRKKYSRILQFPPTLMSSIRVSYHVLFSFILAPTDAFVGTFDPTNFSLLSLQRADDIGRKKQFSKIGDPEETTSDFETGI